MKSKNQFTSKQKPIMVLGTSSGVGKSITVTAICRVLRNNGQKPIPFKGQNMSNNAWVDSNGGEMAHSQVLQAFASRLEPSCEMNPILLKPQGNSKSEVIHLGQSAGVTTAKDYYSNWFHSGWEVIKRALKKILDSNEEYKLIVEGAGSPVEMNLIHRDLTNMKLANYLNADCILVADIEKGGVFAQIVGTLELLKPEERRLIKGIIINRFRGDMDLFIEGRKWIENKTNIPVLGILPLLDRVFPPEDSLDILDRETTLTNSVLKIGIIKLPSISNFSDFDPLENEPSIKISWIKDCQKLKDYDLIIIPGSKQTIQDQLFLTKSGLNNKIKEYSENGGNIFGICGGLQILGKNLQDPFHKEGSYIKGSESTKGLGLLPINTKFHKLKKTTQLNCESLWPCKANIEGFEIHHGESHLVEELNRKETKPLFNKKDLGWYIDNGNKGSISGTYIHGILENDEWRNCYINMIRDKKDLPKLDNKFKTYKIKRDKIIDHLASQFEKHIDMSLILN